MCLKYQLEGQGQKRIFLVHQRFTLNSHRQTLDAGIVTSTVLTENCKQNTKITYNLIIIE